jgi:hypothetical protein
LCPSGKGEHAKNQPDQRSHIDVEEHTPTYGPAKSAFRQVQGRSFSKPFFRNSVSTGEDPLDFRVATIRPGALRSMLDERIGDFSPTDQLVLS